jgi:hypothetical protein
MTLIDSKLGAPDAPTRVASKPWAGLVRVSHTGARRFDRDIQTPNDGRDSVHADRDQVEAVKRGVPRGGTLHLLPAELDV